MRKMNIIKTAVLAAIASVVLLIPTMAAEANFTGWSIEGGAPVFYQTGVKVTNQWVKYGDNYYFAGADGFLVPNRVLSALGVAETGISYIDTNATPVQYEQTTAAATAYTAATNAPVNSISAVNDDFEAFKLLHPEYVTLYANDPAGLVGAYKATYGGGTGSYYLDAIRRYEYGIYNTHHYTFSYSSNGDGTHKAYCACGEYIIEDCNRDGVANTDEKKPHQCTACGFHFHK